MKLTLSVIKADIGSVGGHIAPSQHLLDTVRAHVEGKRGSLITDYYMSHTGDDIAVLMTHRRGAGNADIHQLAWGAFVAGTVAAKQQGLYGAGCMRGSHQMPLMPVPLNTGTSYFDGPPIVSCAAFA